MLSFRSGHPQGFSAGEIDALDPRGAGKPRNVLRERTPLHAILQVCGDLIRHKFEWQRAAFMLAIKPDDMKTVTRSDQLRTDRAGLEREQCLFEFGRCLIGRNLTEVATL